MPYMTNGKRDYKKDYAKYQGRPEQIKNRSTRNKARAMLAKAKGAAAVEGKDVAHSKALSKGGKNTLSNLFAQDKSKNRSFKRKANGKMA